MDNSYNDPWHRVRIIQEPEGRRTIRKIPWATVVLIALNVGIYYYCELAGSTLDSRFMFEHGALEAIAVWEEGQYLRILTAAFLHFGASHLMNNMLMLGIMGDRLETAIGTVRFLIVYLFSAVGANILSVVWYLFREPYTLSVGASGGIMGIAGGMLGVILRRRRSQQGIQRREIVILIVVSLYSSYVAGGTNNIAHISGVLIGAILGYLLG